MRNYRLMAFIAVLMISAVVAHGYCTLRFQGNGSQPSASVSAWLPAETMVHAVAEGADPFGILPFTPFELLLPGIVLAALLLAGHGALRPALRPASAPRRVRWRIKATGPPFM